ncbi:MAG: ribosome assembly RNA-binding protein YhbY [Nitrospirota bacterium]|nr:ribosome assembly RNA-binding protein YhbY [Nitrospirota bacterium]
MSLPELTGKQRRYLRSLSNQLKPTIQIGKEGLSDGVLGSLEAEFAHRELVKLSVNPNCGENARDLAHDLAKTARAHWVQTLGRTVVLYREADPPEIELPE